MAVSARPMFCLRITIISKLEHSERGAFVGFDKERRGVRGVLDWERKTMVHRSVLFYKLALLQGLKCERQLTIAEVCLRLCVCASWGAAKGDRERYMLDTS